jgi:hypothetical protein
MEGVAKTGADLMPIIGEPKKNKRISMAENWMRAFQYCDGQYFIGIDSDVILQGDEVPILIHALDGRDIKIVTMPTKEKNSNRIQHSIFAMKRQTLKDVKLAACNFRCPMCYLINFDFKSNEVAYLKEYMRSETGRYEQKHLLCEDY